MNIVLWQMCCGKCRQRGSHPNLDFKVTFEPLVESTEPQSLTSHLHALSYVNYATSHSWDEIFVKFPSYIIRSTQKLIVILSNQCATCHKTDIFQYMHIK